MRKKTYGESIIERLDALDFKLPIKKILGKLHSGLPKRLEREEALRYYTQKLKRYWRER